MISHLKGTVGLRSRKNYFYSANLQKLSLQLFQADNIELTVPIYKGYGKEHMKKYRLHPDAYIQVALQLAYYRLYKK